MAVNLWFFEDIKNARQKNDTWIYWLYWFTRKCRCLHIETYSHSNTHERPTCFSILNQHKIEQDSWNLMAVNTDTFIGDKCTFWRSFEPFIRWHHKINSWWSNRMYLMKQTAIQNRSMCFEWYPEHCLFFFKALCIFKVYLLTVILQYSQHHWGVT